MFRKKLPGIACDIDGVLIRGSHNPIVSSIPAMRMLRNPSSPYHIPFVCLSNSGGNLEKSKAEQLNHLLNLDSEISRLNAEHIILNFTPFRPIIEKYREKSVLIVGRGKINEIMQDCGVQKFVNMNEFRSLESKTVDKLPTFHKKFQSLKLPFEKWLDISGIFILNDPIEWETNIQLISELLLKNCDIPVYSSHNDALYSDEFPLSRFGLGGFNSVLISLLKKINNLDKKLVFSGKPLSLTFECAKERLKKIADGNKQEISEFYMIGDNPNVDVMGGKNNGFKTILVRTGVFKDKGNDKENPADYVVEDFNEAMRLISKLEKLELI